MNRVGVALLLLLAAQMVVLAYQYRAVREAEDGTSAIYLVRTDTYVVDEIRLEDREHNVAVLRRRGEQWSLPQLDALPADRDRIEALLDVLTHTDPGWPVAHSGAAHQRFQVASYLYRLKVTLSAQGNEVGSVYLGTSPGYRRVHARSAGEEPIYSVPLNLFELPAHDGAWLEPELLQVRAPLRIVADGYSLDRSSGDWLLGSGQPPEPRELDALLQALRTLRLEGVAGDERAQKIRAAEASMILQVTGLGGERKLAFYREGDDCFVTSSDHPYVFRLSAYDYDKLAGIDAVMMAGSGAP
ncbi:DUF4340 domain-containing protein [Mangrovimicrobium sediminis]|uniref:DUF4340 domain-containing protein n=1 Tax=Mangrovimicrobium sediminis TaxID=2562682 RepID=A0A4Z0M922_9GAMM|nr:DUF4340 domain-containing protein [Haliea sp. SAOS-164]TGD75795.1 DUF4340 domain-containing protein [Haliea sp. SAOS-164]